LPVGHARRALIPANYPVVGDDAFARQRVHASAIIKAYHKDDVVLANTSTLASLRTFGMEQIIDIGPMSGKSNVLWGSSVTAFL
jgi:hypothetical protein